MIALKLVFALPFIFNCFPLIQSQIIHSPNYLPHDVEPSAGCNLCESSITFAGEEARQYAVGTQIPTLPFKTKNSWAGRIAIPDTPSSQNASLFFWFWAQDAKVAGDDLVIWLNGGPGCQSLLGMTFENGPFLLEGDRGPLRTNPYSWTIAANILYINQPIGVPFTTGDSYSKNEFQISEQFALWLNEFFKVFPELAEKNLWITGESYEGYYISFQVDAIFRNPPAGNRYKGGMLIDPLFSRDVVQNGVPLYKFVKEHQKDLNFTDEDVAWIKWQSDLCNITNYADLYLHYPPQGPLPLPVHTDCQAWQVFYDLAKNRTNHFNIYNVAHPHKNDTEPTPFEIFFSDPDVQSYIHAITSNNYEILDCGNAFDQYGDRTLPPDEIPNYQDSYFAKMIERSSKFIILHGLLDGILIAEGTEIALQNLTWDHVQGFQKQIHIPLYDMEGNQIGNATEEERKLTFAEVKGSGHMIPEDQPSFALAAILHLLGKRDWTKK